MPLSTTQTKRPSNAFPSTICYFVNSVLFPHLERSELNEVLMKRIFRFLIVLNWVTAIAGVIVSFATQKYLPIELMHYLEARRHQAITQFRMAVFLFDVVFLIVCIIDSIGLFLFRRWAKTLLVPLYVVAILMIPTNDVYIQTGWTKMMFSIGSVIGGMIVSLVFFSPLTEVFDRGPDGEHSARWRAGQSPT
jgi:hypothetical protein